MLFLSIAGGWLIILIIWTFGLDGFTIVSPDGKTYSLNTEHQLIKAANGDALYGYVTLQPDQRTETFLYFTIPGIDMEDLSGWRLAYNSNSYLSNLASNFLGNFREKDYVWLYPAYKAEEISKWAFVDWLLFASSEDYADLILEPLAGFVQKASPVLSETTKKAILNFIVPDYIDNDHAVTIYAAIDS